MNKYILGSVLALGLVSPFLAQAQVQGDIDPNGNQSSCVTIDYNLTVGARDSSTGGDVSELQDFLQSKGYLSINPTGYFGQMTRAAVMRFQSASGILSSGYVGSITRERTQSISCSDASVELPPLTNTSTAACTGGALFHSVTGKRCIPAEPILCTADVKLCPDGSYVSRGGPSCTFGACPSTVPGCVPGALFSSTSGFRCDGSTLENPVYLPGCTSYAGTSTITGNACDGSVSNTVAATVSVTYPVSGMTFTPGQIVPVTWNTPSLSPNANANYTVIYSKIGTDVLIGTYTSAQAHCDASNKCYVSWTIPNINESDISVTVFETTLGKTGGSGYFSITSTPPPPSLSACNLDVDGNGKKDALTDGLLIFRYLSGSRGTALTTGALGTGATRSTSTIESFIAARNYDVDGNGAMSASTDGLMIQRYLFGLSSASITSGALGSGATRSTSEIVTWLNACAPVTTTPPASPTISIALVSTSAISDQNPENETGTFKIRFRVTAAGGAAYVSRRADVTLSGVTEGRTSVHIDRSGTAVMAGAVEMLNLTDPSLNAAGLYQIENGASETFEITTQVQLPSAGASGMYRVALGGVSWGTDPSDETPNNAYVSNLDSFKTSYISLSATTPRPPTPSSLSACNLDVDGNGQKDALTDGLLIMRYQGGSRGTSLTTGAIGSGATRTSASAIESFIAARNYDVDGNGAMSASTDGLMIQRYLFGLSSASITSGAIGSGATRSTSEIVTWLNACAPMTTTPPPATASCSFNGQTVTHGASVTAYQTSTVSYGSACVSEQRTCNNGTLSGSYTNSSCTVSPAPTTATCADADVNNDQVIDLQDVEYVKSKSGLTSTSAGFDPRADLNKNLLINSTDILIAKGLLGSCAGSVAGAATGFIYTWNTDLQIGSTGSDVTALQGALTNEGVYSGEITGGFYTQTFTAVKAFQNKYGIDATGYVGPATRAKLNALY
jgi:peptidoglycan hydrolase-like protein with peptidoglycan-binding domain